MLWTGKGNETKTPGALSLLDLDNNHLRNKPKAAKVVFQILLIGAEVDPPTKSLPSSEDMEMNSSPGNKEIKGWRDSYHRGAE